MPNIAPTVMQLALRIFISLLRRLLSNLLLDPFNVLRSVTFSILQLNWILSRSLAHQLHPRDISTDDMTTPIEGRALQNNDGAHPPGEMLLYPIQLSLPQVLSEDYIGFSDETYHSNPSSTHNSTYFKPEPNSEVDDSHKKAAMTVNEACHSLFAPFRSPVFPTSLMHHPRPATEHHLRQDDLIDETAVRMVDEAYHSISTLEPWPEDFVSAGYLTSRSQSQFHDSTLATGCQFEPDHSIDVGYGGSIPNSENSSQVAKIPKPLCPIESCVKEYQRKGNFVNHFVSKHGRHFPVYDEESGIRMLRRSFHFLSCKDCKPAMLDSATAFAHHIWTHMCDIQVAIEQPRSNSPIPLSPFSLPFKDHHFHVDSGIAGMTSTIDSEKPSQPVSKITIFFKNQNVASEQCLEPGSTPQEASPVNSQAQPEREKSPLPFNATPEHEESQVKPMNDEEPRAREPQQISHWVDATRDETYDPSEPSSIWSPSTKISSPVVDEAMTSSNALVFELLEILQERKEDMDTYDASTGASNSPQDPDSSVTHGSGSEGSSNTNSTSNIIPTVSGIKRSYQTIDGPPDEEDDGEPPKKKPNQKRDPSSVDTPSSKGRCKRIPCTQRDCLGTDEEISLLLRSLMHHHKIVICPDCCTRLTIKDGEKSEEVWKSHKTEQCERQCISRACSGIADDAPRPHRRTTNCVSWRALGDEEKWAFIYTLANPGQTPPTPDISEGAGLRHSRERILRQPRKQARGTEIVEALAKSIEAKDRRILELESDLTAANARNTQLQQGRDDQRTDQEYIIWTLMERLTDKNISIPASIQDRLSSHCPRLMKKPEIISMLSRNQVFPPTPSVTPHASQQRRPDDLLFMDNNPNPSNFDYDNLMSDVPYSAGSYNL